MSDLIAVADTHLMRRDAELDGFVRFLHFIGERGAACGTVVHLGDMFNVWLGRKRFEMSHMAPVLDAFRALRRRGVKTLFVEGNRDFHVARTYRGDVFDEVTEVGTTVTIGGRRIHMSHGDLVNTKDRPYRLWRSVSHSALVWGLVGFLPSKAGIGLAESLEGRLRGTNVRHKSYFPEETARRYAEKIIERGHDLLLTGHFHEERVIDLDGGTMIVLPDWRSGHRYLRVTSGGSWRMEHWSAR